MRLAPLITAVALAALCAPASRAEEESEGWEFLSRNAIGARQFTDAHPTWDGRGVLVAICDSGVELGLPGLAETSDKQPKVLDARVFSDDGLTSLKPATQGKDERGAYRKAGGKRRLYGVDALDPPPADGAPVLLGWFAEDANRGGRVRDLDGNGNSDGVFGVLTYRPAGAAEKDPWIAFVDTDGDGELGDEQPVRDYAVERETFRLSSGGPEPHTEQRVLFALNLDPQAKKAWLYWGGGHGTHVAGITAGHQLNGQAEFDGIAPGAQILALKIGAEGLPGSPTTPGSMIAAWRYAVKKAAELELPLVIQMSYGVGSEDEGRAVAERLIDELLRKHPGVVATVSAGNDGPGISTIGLPSCAQEPLSVGAAIPRSTARDVYGFDVPDHRLFGFSSRGGETAKPEVVCPGVAASSVPDWHGARDVMSGTSMAAPQGAGACALVLSAAKAEGLPIRRDLLRAALIRTARPLAAYGPLDQGAGMVDVPRAFDVYRELAGRGDHAPVSWKVETESPESSSGTGPTIFYRGDYYPRDGATQEVKVRAVFPNGAKEEDKRRAFSAFDFTCDARWVRLAKDASYARQSGALTLPVEFVAEHLQHHGLYQTRILAFDKALGPGNWTGPEFQIPVAIVVPYRFETATDGVVRHTTPGLDTEVIDRVFVHVPRRIGSVSIFTRVRNEGPGQDAYLTLFDGEGRRHRMPKLDAKKREARSRFSTADVQPGVWEICIAGARGTSKPVAVDVELRAFGLSSPLSGSVKLVHKAGAAPHGKLAVTSSMAGAWRGRASGKVVGIHAAASHDVRGPKFTRKYQLAPGERGLVLDLELPVDSWGKFTDLAIRLLGPDGKPVVTSAMDYRHETVRHESDDAKGTYTLELYAATADPKDAKVTWSVGIDETRLLDDPVGVTLKRSGKPRFTLYPDQDTELALRLAGTPPAAPAGFAWRAELTFRPDDTRDPELTFATDLELR